MIYYFSGTGNSGYVAGQLAKYTKDAALFIPEVFDAMESDITVGAGETVGVVFPVYAWAPPAVVIDFLSHVHVDKKAFAYAVCTCGDEAGKSMDELRRVFPFKSAYSVTMPNNYIPLYDVDEPELMREKINVATQRLPKIGSEILARREIIDVHEGPEASFKTIVINPLFSLFAMRTSRFSADSTCVGCGECEKSCAFGFIKFVDRKPVWEEGKCQMCMSCIMHCPVRAIQYGSGTRKRGRYVFPDQGAGQNRRIQPQDSPSAQSDGRKQDVQNRAERAAEFINRLDIKSFSNPGVVSRQLLTPANSNGRQAAVTEVHVQPGAMQPKHTHASSEQIWYALRGSGKLLLSDNKEHILSAGDVVRFPENTLHGFINSRDEEFVYISITCPPVNFAAGYLKDR
jgi:quercetin dioxygenase-like cupin family protein/ferredoxin